MRDVLARGVLRVGRREVVDHGSKLHGVEGAMDGGQRVWAPHPEGGYKLGLIVDVSTDTLTVDPLQGGRSVVLPTGLRVWMS